MTWGMLLNTAPTKKLSGPLEPELGKNCRLGGGAGGCLLRWAPCQIVAEGTVQPWVGSYLGTEYCSASPVQGGLGAQRQVIIFINPEQSSFNNNSKSSILY